MFGDYFQNIWYFQKHCSVRYTWRNRSTPCSLCWNWNYVYQNGHLNIVIMILKKLKQSIIKRRIFFENTLLNQSFPLYPFSIPWKHQKTNGYRKGALGRNGLRGIKIWQENIYSDSSVNVSKWYMTIFKKIGVPEKLQNRGLL